MRLFFYGCRVGLGCFRRRGYRKMSVILKDTGVEMAGSPGPFGEKCLYFPEKAAALFPAGGAGIGHWRRRGAEKDEAARPHGQAASKQTVVMKK